MLNLFFSFFFSFSLSTKDYWRYSIPREGDTLVDLPEPSGQGAGISASGTNEFGCEECRVRVPDANILLAFRETGPETGNLYQPWFDLDYSSHAKQDDESVPILMHSIDDCAPEERTQKALYYSKTCSRLLQCSMTNAGEDLAPDSQGQSDVIRSLPGVCADYVKPKDFARMLWFFGYRWVKNGRPVNHDGISAVVEASDLARFLDLFHGNNWQTKKGFEMFLKEFKFGDLFEYCKSATLKSNIKKFYRFYRSWCKIRLAFPNCGDEINRQSLASHTAVTVNVVALQTLHGHPRKEAFKTVCEGLSTLHPLSCGVFSRSALPPSGLRLEVYVATNQEGAIRGKHAQHSNAATNRFVKVTLFLFFF